MEEYFTKWKLKKLPGYCISFSKSLPISDPSVGHWSLQYPHLTGTPEEESSCVGQNGPIRVVMHFVFSFPLKLKGNLQGIPSNVLHCLGSVSSYSS